MLEAAYWSRWYIGWCTSIRLSGKRCTARPRGLIDNGIAARACLCAGPRGLCQRTEREIGKVFCVNENDCQGSDADACSIFSAIETAVTAVGKAERRVSKSQIGFYRKHPFAAVWRPSQYLSGTHLPLVLSVFLLRRDRSPRWKEVVEPKPGRFTHHLEINGVTEVDDQVREWLREAWASAS